MGKRGGAKNSSHLGSRSQNNPISLREEATGKIQTKPASNIKSNLRVDHLKKLAVWATNDTPILSLGAFYGQHLATVAEAAGVPPDSSLTTCQRCETVLHPGFNSTVRIEKSRSKVRHRHKSGNISQNNIVYTCNFCLHKNLKKGTPKGHLKGICPSKEKPSLELTPRRPITHESSKFEKGIVSKDEANEIDVFASRVAAKDVALVDGLPTPSCSSTPTLSEGKKRMRNSSTSKKAIETASLSAKVEGKPLSTASKRRRKSWISLKDIAKGKEHDNNQVANLTIPFFL
ncbi:uncharacterized protein LOC130741179 isoform X2 [Lotus japonicus]|nr:uncharacterized protein LOC130741179 isoform X2 [Lotus japonicus]